MWNEINNDIEMLQFMDDMYSFHDSCIKEIRYISGAYVDSQLFMHPVNDQRVLRVAIQRQFDENRMIELEFRGLKLLQLCPTDEKYTCEISDATLFIKDAYIYWCDTGGLSMEDIEGYKGTLICASKLRWRSIEGSLEDETFYKSVL